VSAKRALITGVTGQDGAYLAQYLLGLDYEVLGGSRDPSRANLWRLRELGIAEQVKLIPLDITDSHSIRRTLQETRPDEIYNFAAQTYVGKSFEDPVYSGEVNGIGVARLLEGVSLCVPDAKFCQASSSNMFGKAESVPQTETTPFYPRSPYAVAKLYAHWMTINYRENKKLFACSGILFNHESPLRGEEFVTRKIARGLARLARGCDKPVRLGNLESRRDWGFAGDYVRGMWLMLQHDQPEDFVLSTGRAHSVRQFAEAAASAAGFQLEWKREPDSLEIGLDRRSGRRLIVVDQGEFRPAEVEHLLGDSSKAAKLLGWKPQVEFFQLVELMVRAEMEREILTDIPDSSAVRHEHFGSAATTP